MNVWPLKEMYHQAAILCIDREHDLHISVKDNKIIIYLINKDTKGFISPNIASTVQECLTLTLKKTFIAAPINLKDKAAGMDDFNSL
jgi:hypothetical protein